MSKRLTCPQGHEYEAQTDSGGTTGQRPRCPVCGTAHDAANGDPEVTLYAKVKPAADDSPPTLPGAELPPADDGPHELPVVTGYEILEELGRGGMGVVYRARQAGLNRIVALKMVLAGVHAGPKSLGRFRSEAEAVAKLQHPNIVQIYEVGEQDDRPFFSLEYVDGGSLAKRLAGTPQSPPAAAALTETLARAIHYAHQRGIIHRDLKPANILLAVVGDQWSVARKEPEIASSLTTDHWPLTTVAKITDFGLAKQLESASALSHSGAVVGTPSYMAPEQAGGKAGEVGPPADVYSLGAILYELLTGRAPFRGETALDTMLQVLSEDPVPPARLQPKLPRDLETICLRCLEKDPRRRYPTALDLADELRRFLNHEPIQARPLGPLARGQRWCRRNPVLAAVSLLAVAALLTVVGLSIGFGFREAQAAHRLESEQKSTQEALEIATEQTRLAQIANEKWRRFERMSASLALDQGLRLCEQGDIQRGMLWLARSLEIAPPQAEDLQRAIRANLEHWRNQLHALQNCLDHPAPVMAVAFSSDGKAVLTGSEDGIARLWDTATGRPLGPQFRHGKNISGVAFGPNGQTVVTAGLDGLVLQWDLHSGKRIGEPIRHNGVIGALALSPNGKRLATTSFDEAQVWDIATGKPIGPLLKHDNHVTAVAFSPDGRTVLTGSLDKTARLWDAATGKPMSPPLQHADSVMAVAVSPDGTRIATGCGRNAKSAQLWDFATGKAVGPALLHRDRVSAVAFSPDSKTLLTGGFDKTARLWDAASGRRLGVVLQHKGDVRAVAFCSDGVTFVTAGADKTARLWEAMLDRPHRPLLTHKAQVTAVAFGVDGNSVLSGDYDRRVHFWDLATGRPLRGPFVHPSPVMALALSPDGKTLVTGTNDDRAQVWDVASGKMRIARLPHEDAVPAVAYHPGGKAVLTGSRDQTARLWDPETGKPLSAAIRHPDKVTAVAFHPDGQMFATACEDRMVRLWQTSTGKRIGNVLAHPDSVLAVAFSPDGKTLLTGCRDKAARFWSVADGKEVGVPLPHQGEVLSVAYSPDGRTVLTGSNDNTARLWEADTGKQIGPPLQHLDSVLAVAFSADGKVLMTGSDDKTARLWDGPSLLADEVEQVVLRAQLITGMELDERGTVRELDVASWLERKKRLDAWIAPALPGGHRPTS
jgi:eukaryotic-like serine/threonine-protein kinase